MKTIMNALRRFSYFSKISNETGNLGRWKLVDSSKQFERVDRSNNDHCGTCLYIDFKKSTIQNTEK